MNGTKKWITGGLFGDFFTCAVRTGMRLLNENEWDDQSDSLGLLISCFSLLGGAGMSGISLLLLEKDMPGISIRKMETQFDNSHNTTFITLEDVRVPKKNLIGEENQGTLSTLIAYCIVSLIWQDLCF